MTNTRRASLSAGTAALLLLLGAVLAGAAMARDRSVTDMPDDLSGPQIHFLYVVPSDGADGQLDTNGGMEQSIARIEHWFEGQTGDQALRIDTYKGVPDITFVRLPHSDAQATSTNPWPLWVMGQDLVAAGFNNPAKAYAAFYDGHSTWACGGAKSPALPQLGAMYLRAWPSHDPRPCSEAPGIGTGLLAPGYFEIGLLHEVMHSLGFTPRCAPHASVDGYGDHVDDSPTDIMYGPDVRSTAGWNWSHAVLDYNHDDYYRARIPGCPDLANSAYIGPIPSFHLNVTVLGRGSVEATLGTTSAEPCSNACSVSVLRGTLVTLSASPAAGYTFVGWGDTCSGTELCQLTVAGDGAVTAVFKASPLRLRVARSGVTVRAKAGKPFSAWISVRRGDTNDLVAGGRVTCTARVGGQTLPIRSTRVVHGVVQCGWLVPNSAAGKRLHASVSLAVGGAAATKTFELTVG
jgi:hypothetical protein